VDIGAPVPGGLVHGFGISSELRVISLVGAGGKTSLMYALAREMVGLGQTVVSATTTKIYPPQTGESPSLILARNASELSDLPARLSEFRHVTVGRSIDPSTSKLQGVSDETISALAGSADRVLVEADGAAGRPVKAPASWEPVIPSATDLVILVVGLDCLGRPAEDKWVFRLKEFLALTCLVTGDPVTPQSIGRLVTDPNGGLKGVAPRMTLVPFLNKFDLLIERELAMETVNAIRERSSGRIRRIVVGTLKQAVRLEVYECDEPMGY
jgi:probable selenium-dependent hydroxylase accessory protein YqeC